MKIWSNYDNFYEVKIRVIYSKFIYIYYSTISQDPSTWSNRSSINRGIFVYTIVSITRIVFLSPGNYYTLNAIFVAISQM